MGHLPLLNSFPRCRFRISRFLPFKGIDKPGHWVVMVTHSNQLQLLTLSPQGAGGWVIVSVFQTDQNYSLQIILLLVAPCDIYAT